MKKILAVLLATLMVAGMLPFVLLGAAASDRTILPAITGDQDGRHYFYYQSFDYEGILQGADPVAEKLGLLVPENDAFAKNHEENVNATEGGEDVAYLYELRDGKLYLRNHGTKNELMVLARGKEFTEAMKGRFGIEYTLTYLPGSTGADGYFTILYALDEANGTYGMAPVRISGYGNNTTSAGAVLDSGEITGKKTGDLLSMSAYNLLDPVNPTLYNRVFDSELQYYPEGSNRSDLRGSDILAGKEIHVRMIFDGTYGPSVFVNDVQVSAPVDTDAAQSAYAALIAAESLSLGFVLTPGTECIVDDVMLYGGALGDEEEAPQNSLYITEICLTPAVSGTMYLEIYNNGEEAVNLADFGLVYTENSAGAWDKTSTYTNYIEFAKYFGKTLTFGTGAAATTLTNPAKLTLQPGECAILYFAVAAAGTEGAPNPATTVDGVTMAGFRAAYGLDADAKVLGIPTASAKDESGNTVQAASPSFFLLTGLSPVHAKAYNFSLVSAADETGAAIAWKTQKTQNTSMDAYVQSRVEYVPALVSGSAGEIDDNSFTLSLNTVYSNGSALPIYRFGAGGLAKSGYAAQYLYALNGAEEYWFGTMISYAYTEVAAEKSVGNITALQEAYFGKLISRRENGYHADGGLVITKYVPVTGYLTEGKTGISDAFDAFEITNTSDKLVNLYQYGLVSGVPGAWKQATLFEAQPTTADPAGSAVLPQYQNPAECLLAPGATVVIWNYTADTVAAAGADTTTGRYTVADFRSYHGILEEVRVIVAASFASENGVIAENEKTISYGVAAAADINAYRKGETDTIKSAVSDITVPVSAMSFSTVSEAVDVTEIMRVNPVVGSYLVHYGYGTATRVTVEEGASVAGYFTKAGTGNVALSSPTTEIYLYTPCGENEVAAANVEYYTIANGEAGYGSSMDHQLPVGTAISFTYNNGNYTAGMTSGMLMGDLRFSSLAFDAFRLRAAGMTEKNEVPYIMTRPSAFITPKTANTTLCERDTLGTLANGQVTIAGGSGEMNGYVITWLDEEGTVTSTVTLAKNACRGAYTILPYFCEHWLVNGVPYNAGDKVEITGNTEIRPSTEEVNANTVTLRLNGTAEDSGIRFTTAVSKELYNRLVATYGKENVHLKTAIAPAAYFAAAESATLEGLEALGHKTNYVAVEATGFYAESETELVFAGSLVDIQNKDMAFCGLGYLEVETENGMERFYGATESADYTIAGMAAAELADVVGTGDEVYRYAVEDKYSAYTEEERRFLSTFC